jgi:hypothetical protein
MLIFYNEQLIINHPIRTFFVYGFQLSNKKEFILCLFEIPLVDSLTLTNVLSLFNFFIIITSESSLQHQYHFINCNLYSSHPCGSTPILLGYLLLWHSYTWDKTSIFWSYQWVNKSMVSTNSFKISIQFYIFTTSFYLDRFNFWKELSFNLSLKLLKNIENIKLVN